MCFWICYNGHKTATVIFCEFDVHSVHISIRLLLSRCKTSSYNVEMAWSGSASTDSSGVPSDRTRKQGKSNGSASIDSGGGRSNRTRSSTRKQGKSKVAPLLTAVVVPATVFLE